MAKPSKEILLNRVRLAARTRQEARDALAAAEQDIYGEIVVALQAGVGAPEVAEASTDSAVYVRAIRRAHNIPPARPGRRAAAA